MVTRKKGKTLKSQYRKPYLAKLADGAGGWHCPCCNKYRCSANKMKKRARRMVRRVERQNLNKEDAE